MAEAFKIEITAIRIHQTSRKRNISCIKSIYLFDRVKKKKKKRFREQNKHKFFVEDLYAYLIL